MSEDNTPVPIPAPENTQLVDLSPWQEATLKREPFGRDLGNVGALALQGSVLSQPEPDASEPTWLKHTATTTVKTTKHFGDSSVASDMSVDLHNFGGVARASDIHAAAALGVRDKQNELPRVIKRSMVRGKFSSTSKEERVELQAIHNSSESLQAELKELTKVSNPHVAAEFIRSRIGTMQSEFTNTHLPMNFEMIMEGADINVATQQAHDAANSELGGISWRQWLGTAPVDQLINFSQWYTHRLETLANRQTREAFVHKIKEQYFGDITRAIQDGWLEDRHLALATQRIAKADVAFFSPFGKVPGLFAGAAQGDHKHVILPTITGRPVTIHEFGHIFKHFDEQDTLPKWLESQGRIPFLSANQKELKTALEEGYNEHMTQALERGLPEVIDPDERVQKGVVDLRGSSEGYKTLRKLFGNLLMGDGSQPSLTPKDITRLVDAVEDFDMFRALVAERWNGKDVLGDLFSQVENVKTYQVVDRASNYLASLRNDSTAATSVN